MVALPWFTYHPDPLATGSVEASGARCACCGRERGYIYTATVYGAGELRGHLCPWCIADGSAAGRFNAVYSDDQALIAAGVPDAVIEEVTRRTPGFQPAPADGWKCCCGDACEYHGPASRAHLGLLATPAVEQFLSLTKWTPEQWTDFVSDVSGPEASPTVFHFVCRACKESKFDWDDN